MRISIRLAALAAAAAVLNMTGWAQASHTVNGQWQGTMKVPSVKDPKLKEDFPIVVDLTKNQKGEWIGTFGMPEIGANGFPLANLVVGQSSVSFTVPELPMKPTPSFDAKLSPDGKTLSGTLTTGTDKVPISLKRTGEAKVAIPGANSILTKAFEGTWQATYDTGGPTKYHLVLKLSRRPDGTATGTLTNVDGGNAENPVTGIGVEGSYLQFEIRALAGKFRGSLNAAGTEIKGEWMQTATTPLTFTRGASLTSVNSVLPKAFEGTWEGTFVAGAGAELRMEFVLKLGRSADGSATGTLSNKEAKSRELPLSVIMVKGKSVQFDVGLIKGKYHGTLNALGTAIEGTWEQEDMVSAPVTFKRPASAAKK